MHRLLFVGNKTLIFFFICRNKIFHLNDFWLFISDRNQKHATFNSFSGCAQQLNIRGDKQMDGEKEKKRKKAS